MCFHKQHFLLSEEAGQGRGWAKSGLHPEFYDILSVSNLTKRKETLDLRASPAGVSLQLVVVLVFTLMLPNIGQLIGNRDHCSQRDCCLLSVWPLGRHLCCPEMHKAPKLNVIQTVKVCFKCQINLAKGWTASFTWENIVLIDFLWNIKISFLKCLNIPTNM